MLLEKQLIDFCAKFPATLRDEPMSKHTYLKIGGPAALYAVAGSADELISMVDAARAFEIPLYLFGGGANLLVSDAGFQGVVIQSAERMQNIDGERVTASAGVMTVALARAVAEAGLAGFEWGIGVPGTIGGATYGDAGCFGGEMRDVVESVEAYRLSDGTCVTYTNAECQFAYRESRFKHEPHVLLRTTLKLVRGNAAEIKAKMDVIAGNRKESQPQGAFSAGCLFKNFEYMDESVIEKLKSVYEVPSEMLAKHRIPAGWLVDQLGLKGTAVGKAQVSPVHGNFLINLGGATADDVVALASLVKMKVRDELGILMEDEVQYVG